jgi:WXG100 family type VII secretion target
VPNIDTSSIMVQGELAAAGSNINGQALAITGQLDSLKQQLAPLQDYWMGQAATLYESYQQEWNAAAYGLFGADGTGGVLGAIAHAMGVVWGNYSDAEWANVQTWQST